MGAGPRKAFKQPSGQLISMGDLKRIQFRPQLPASPHGRPLRGPPTETARAASTVRLLNTEAPRVAPASLHFGPARAFWPPESKSRVALSYFVRIPTLSAPIPIAGARLSITGRSRALCRPLSGLSTPLISGAASASDGLLLRGWRRRPVSAGFSSIFRRR